MKGPLFNISIFLFPFISAYAQKFLTPDKCFVRQIGVNDINSFNSPSMFNIDLTQLE